MGNMLEDFDKHLKKAKEQAKLRKAEHEKAKAKEQTNKSDNQDSSILF